MELTELRRAIRAEANLTPIAKLSFDVIVEAAPATVTIVDVAAAIGASYWQVGIHCRDLAKRGLIIQGKNGRWTTFHLPAIQGAL